MSTFLLNMPSTCRKQVEPFVFLYLLFHIKQLFSSLNVPGCPVSFLLPGRSGRLLQRALVSSTPAQRPSHAFASKCLSSLKQNANSACRLWKSDALWPLTHMQQLCQVLGSPRAVCRGLRLHLCGAARSWTLRDTGVRKHRRIPE